METEPASQVVLGGRLCGGTDGNRIGRRADGVILPGPDHSGKVGCWNFSRTVPSGRKTTARLPFDRA
jgi:hypothetical protein